LFASVALACLAAGLASAQSQSGPKPKLIDLGAFDESRTLLSGSPETVTMRSGMVVIAPSKSVGTHSTNTYEEAVVVFDGVGEMRFADGSVIRVKPRTVVYCPPMTEHDVVNTGTASLRYVYVVAQAR
jgi:mannose-6-phosphate isomerase-like protein (cupin superfamily)